jgi:hypothetical protein
MDPYLEEQWSDFHSRFITYIGDAIQPKLPDALRARMEERVYVEPLTERIVRPDITVHEYPAARRQGGGRAEASEGGVAVAEPMLVHLRPPVEVTDRFVQILNVQTEVKVTSIEVLSAANKAHGRGREEYLRKQKEFLDGNINLVEIDLLRSGLPTTLLSPSLIAPRPPSTYHVSVRRSSTPEVMEYYPFSLRQPLPWIKIPLRSDDKDVLLNLQELLNTAYDRGRYDDIDYSKQPIPPLEGDDHTWADALLRTAGVRG